MIEKELQRPTWCHISRGLNVFSTTLIRQVKWRRWRRQQRGRRVLFTQKV